MRTAVYGCLLCPIGLNAVRSHSVIRVSAWEEKKITHNYDWLSEEINDGIIWDNWVISYLKVCIECVMHLNTCSAFIIDPSVSEKKLTGAGAGVGGETIFF